MGEMLNRWTYIGEYTLSKSITIYEDKLSTVCVELYSFDVATRTSSNQSILVGRSSPLSRNRQKSPAVGEMIA